MSKNNYLKEQILYCQYCGKECKNLNSLKQHECRCKQNPNRIVNPMKNKDTVIKNKIKSLQTLRNNYKIKKENKIAEYDKNPKLCLQCGKPLSYQQAKSGRKFCCGRCSNLSRPPRSEESKKKTRETIHANFINGSVSTGNYSKRFKQGWYKGFHCDSSYELVYLIYCLDHNINIKRCNKVYEYFYEGSKHLYFPDFIINNDTIVEIKGYYTELVDIKTNSVNDMNYKILYKKDLQKEFEYVYQTYNVDNKTIQTLYEKNII